jgi:hypothetical protein
MLRPSIAIVTALGCIGAGATGSLCAFAISNGWQLLFSESFSYVIAFGVNRGLWGSAISIICILITDRKYLWATSINSILLTGLLVFAYSKLIFAAVDLD